MEWRTDMNEQRSESLAAHVLLEIPRPAKRLIALAVDASLCVFTVWLALCLRLEQWVRLEPAHWWAVAGSVLLALPVFARFGLYRAIFRYAGWNAMMSLAQAMAIYSLFFATVFTVISVPGVPRSVGIVQPLLLGACIGLSRVAVRYWLGGLYRTMLLRRTLPGVLIYGAGTSGRQLAAALARSQEQRLIGFIDDNPALQNNHLDGRRVHRPQDLENLIRDEGVTDVLLAIPSAARLERLRIVERLRPLPVHVRTLPAMADLAAGRAQFSDLRELDIEDLLGRAPVAPDDQLLRQFITGQTVAVTGAGGSIGSELCRQILACKPATLLLVENSEYALYRIHQELQASAAEGSTVIPLLASVQDEARMGEILQAWRPHTLYHAAAYKHVPLVEHNPVEGLRNNVWGTWNTARAAQAAGVRHFVLVSTDKAVRPTNIMGASKRLAELVLQAMASESGNTTFSMVRFGNVLGSSGSVVPLFRQQIAAGGPITLTHPDITRYFMTIPEAAQLVIQAGAMAQGGDVFLLDMGEPVRIIDLAHRMVQLTGLQVRTPERPWGQIEIQITGLRPGEKLYEELLIGENPQPTRHPRIKKAHEARLEAASLRSLLQRLDNAMVAHDVHSIRHLLREAVQGYEPAGEVVDWLHSGHGNELERKGSVQA
jgi:FlaA1/EpsC-like NDP-sugar epimerase